MRFGNLSCGKQSEIILSTIVRRIGGWMGGWVGGSFPIL